MHILRRAISQGDEFGQLVLRHRQESKQNQVILAVDIIPEEASFVAIQKIAQLQQVVGPFFKIHFRCHIHEFADCHFDLPNHRLRAQLLNLEVAELQQPL